MGSPTGISIGLTDASACGLTDRLYGRQPIVVAPIPITNGTSIPYTATYAPYGSSYAPYASSYSGGSLPYTAGYTPLISTPFPSGIYSAAPTYSVQQPAYGAVPLDNPSVYTGLPVTSGYRGLATPGNTFYGTGNIYPDNYASASPTVTAMRPTYADPGFQTPIRSGLARFFDSLLGTGYRTSYYTAPITYYRPATTIDPYSGTTITTQQACASSVQQLQRTPYATFEPTYGAPSFVPGAIAPCGGIDCGGSDCGVTSIPSTMVPSNAMPSTMSPSTITPPSVTQSSPYGGSNNGYDSGDYQPMSPPVSNQPTYSQRPEISPELSSPYPTSDYQSGSSTNLAPLTGARPSYETEFRDSRSTDSVYQPYSSESVPSASDRKPMEAPELNSARSANSQAETDEAYRRGYEAAQQESQQESQRQRDAEISRDRQRADERANERADDRVEEPSQGQDRPPIRSQYQLDPPSNYQPSTDDTQRSRFEIERDRRDLRDLTTQNRQNDPAWYRVRPIPAPENYHNPFEATKQPVSQTDLPSKSSSKSPVEKNVVPDPRDLRAPDLLPSLPPPPSTVRPARGYDRPTRYNNETRSSVPVREASMLSTNPPPHTTRETIADGPRANDWRNKVRQSQRETGWYSKD